jgi:hypothetical protein
LGGDIALKIGLDALLPGALVRAVREQIIAKFGFDPGKDNAQESLERACETIV